MDITMALMQYHGAMELTPPCETNTDLYVVKGSYLLINE